MRWWLSQTVVPVFKKMRVLGFVRFRILRLIYRIFWWGSPRNGEWEFILSWLRPLRYWQKPVYVLDVGSTESLLIYELLHRGYDVKGVDQRPYQEPNEHTVIKDLLYDDISTLAPSYNNAFGEKKEGFDYIIACSTVEHIGLQAYGEHYVGVFQEDRDVMIKLHGILNKNGYLIITVPNKHLGTDTGRGYSYQDFCEMIKDYYKIIHYTEKSNQICAVLVKL
jgi:SAM-dependent methyltransferase